MLFESVAIAFLCEAYSYLAGIVIQTAEGGHSFSFSLFALDLWLLSFGGPLITNCGCIRQGELIFV
jgi:hypothetical protein